MEKPIDPTKSSPRQKEAAQRDANKYFLTSEHKTALAKQQTAAASSANDAKTARLRALRLAKEAADEAAGIADANNTPKRPAKKRPE